MSKGGGGGTNTIQKADPYIGQQPFLKDIYAQSQDLFQRGGPQLFPGRLTAPVSDRTLQAEAMQAQNALGAQQNLANQIGAAQQFALAGPQNIASNPFLASTTEAALRPIFSQTQSLLQQARRGANQAGQLGGDRQAILEQGVIGDFLTKAGDVSSRIGSQAYRDALTSQARALAFAPQTLASFNVPAQTLGQIGLAEQARAQLALDEQRARFEAEQMRPETALDNYARRVMSGGVIPGTKTGSINAPDPSFGQRALSGTAAGLGTYGTLTAGAGTAAGPTFGALANPAIAGPIAAAIGLLAATS